MKTVRAGSARPQRQFRRHAAGPAVPRPRTQDAHPRRGHSRGRGRASPAPADAPVFHLRTSQVIEVFAISTDVGVWTTGPIKVSELEREPPAPPKEF